MCNMKRSPISAVFSLFILPLANLFGTVHAQPPKNPMIIQQVNPGSSNSKTNQGGQTFNQAAEKLLKSAAFGDAGGQSGNSLATDYAANLAKSTTFNEATFTYANTITAADLKAHLGFLASDELEGRETATRGQKIAAKYLAAQFEKFGLQPGNKGKWFQEFELEQVNIKDVQVVLGGKTTLKKGDDFLYFDKFGLASPQSYPVVFGGYGISESRYDNLDGLNLKGKAVFVLTGEPQRDTINVLSGSDEPSIWGKDANAKRNALKQAGAAMMITVVPDEKFKANSANSWVKHRMEGSGLRLAYQKEAAGIPSIMVPERVFAAYIKKNGYSYESLRQKMNGKDDVPEIDLKKAEIEIKPDAVLEKIFSENVLGFLEGTDKKDEVVVLTAHYDHLGIKEGQIYYGADDDGSGTAAILELAEAFAQAAKNGYRPRRSILFMPVSGEEKGLLGSEYYSDHAVYPLRKTVCNLNIDMIGRLDADHEKDSNYVYVIGSDMLSSDLHRANEQANLAFANIKLDYRYSDPADPNQFYYRSDHYNFAKNDVPVIFYFTGVHEDYHKPTDTIDKIMFGKMAKITRLVFATAWEAANKEEKFVVDKKK